MPIATRCGAIVIVGMCCGWGAIGVHSAALGSTFVVAPGGNDKNTGTAERPLATLEAARDAARKAHEGPHQIVAMPGEYYLAATLELDARDSGLTIEGDKGGAVTLYGGRPIKGWHRDGDKFWCIDLPEVKEGKWDFRALVVNGRMAERARLPQTGTFVHGSVFDVRWLSTVAGGWERKPTHEELTTMRYRAEDVPKTLEGRNAEVRLYHMWDESLVGVESNDPERHMLRFSTPAHSPPGAFGVKKYVLFNIREGMTQPGQWYLDRAEGKVVYWPLPGEDMARAKVIAPTLERVVRIAGTAKQKVEKITLRGISIQATNVPLKPAGFGGGGFEGALSITSARSCVLENVEISNVSGLGLRGEGLSDSRIVACRIHHTGACGVKLSASGTSISRSHIHHVGVSYSGAAAAILGGERVVVSRNEIHDAPYSGIIAGGKEHLFEENLVYRVMRELHDGAAFYGGMERSTLRGNVVRDVVEVGAGYGASAYYLDEGSRDCVVERNVAVGVPMPTHNHITRNTILRDNVFIADKDMTVSFARSSNCTFERNTLYAPGKITIGHPNGIKVWKDNVIFRNGSGKNDLPQAFTIDGAMPPVPMPGRKSWGVAAARVNAPLRVKGEAVWEEWPGKLYALDRDRSRQQACGAPVFAKVAYDDRFLYVEAIASMFEPAEVSTGSNWGKDDGVEILIEGKAADGRPTAVSIRGYAGGTVQSMTIAGDAKEVAARLEKEVKFAAKVTKGPSGKPKGWRGRWAIPLATIGLTPKAGMKVAFNVACYTSEFGEWHCWEGTEAGRLEEAGTLQFQ